MKILVAADGSDYTKRMLAYLAAHDEFIGASNDFTVATAVPAIPPRAAATLGHDEVQSYYADEAERVFAPIRAFLEQRGIKATFTHLVGHAGDVIARHAEQGRYDLLVMGSHGHGALSGLVMGSTTTKVLAQCRTPVLLIR